jgi:signal transduction histidine kinase
MVLRLRSLRTIAIAFIAAMSLATLATGATVYLALVEVINRQVDKRLEGEAAELLAGAPSGSVLARRIGDEAGRRDSGDIGFVLRDAAGRQLAGNIALSGALPLGTGSIGRRADIPGLTHGRVLVRSLPGDGTLTLVAESEPIDHHNTHRLLILAAGFGMILLLSVAGAVALTLAVRRNIADVRRAAEAIVDGDLQARVPAAGIGKAFGEQALAFNRMLDRIGELMGSLAGISNDIAHDMRTPLARLHGQLARLASDPRAAPVQADVAEAAGQSQELLGMFAAMLRITEVEGGDRRSGFAPVDLGALAADVVESLEAMVSASDRSLILGEVTSTSVEGDARLLTQLLVNLIENAVHHTPPGTTIMVSATLNGAEAMLRVADDGPGIPPADRTLALRRFGRLAHSRGQPGHGLGLPLVQAIARLHRGTLTLADARPGLAVEVRLPPSG